MTISFTWQVDMQEANLLRTTSAIGPQPPAAEKASSDTTIKDTFVCI